LFEPRCWTEQNWNKSSIMRAGAERFWAETLCIEIACSERITYLKIRPVAEDPLCLEWSIILLYPSPAYTLICVNV
jgi:hypothetical protein